MKPLPFAVDAKAIKEPSGANVGSVSSAGPSVSLPGKETLLPGLKPPELVYKKYKCAWPAPPLASGADVLTAENTKSWLSFGENVGRSTWPNPVDPADADSVEPRTVSDAGGFGFAVVGDKPVAVAVPVDSMEYEKGSEYRFCVPGVAASDVNAIWRLF